MEKEVDDEEHGGPVHHRWVQVTAGAEGAEPGDEGHAKRDSVERVHYHEVRLCLAAQRLARLPRQRLENFGEADEVEVVGQVYHEEEPCDVLVRQVEHNKHRQDNDVKQHDHGDERAASILGVVYLDGDCHHEDQNANLSDDEDDLHDVHPSLLRFFGSCELLF